MEVKTEIQENELKQKAEAVTVGEWHVGAMRWETMFWYPLICLVSLTHDWAVWGEQEDLSCGNHQWVASVNGLQAVKLRCWLSDSVKMSCRQMIEYQ